MQAAQGAALSCRVTQARSAELLRLGLVMGLTMTLHNMPEGFAVGQASACLGVGVPGHHCSQPVQVAAVPPICLREALPQHTSRLVCWGG